jgi:glycosyltransferase A (GT-A) superfamily protein (DUF2064 family)/8-oxo-dGTP pyrophosphatase MutT (NUDIX family)
VPPLTPAQAAALHETLLLDTLAACRAEIPDTALLYAEQEEARQLASLTGSDTPLVLQEGRGLADALRLGMARHVQRGPTALVPSDLPGIAPGSLGQAFAALDGGADVVLGPALDGGYWLIAMREYSDAPFRSIPWSTPAVFAVTVRRCEQAGLSVATLEPWRDVDTPADLAYLLARADELPAPRTARLLRTLELDGLVGEPPHVRLDSSQLVTGSPWRAVIEDRLLTEDGRYTGYTYLTMPPAVFVVPVTENDEVVLVRRYRHPVRDWTIEIPAGAVEQGESPQEAAERQLAEEVGGRANRWRHLTTFYSSSAHISMRSEAFLATGVSLGRAAPGLDKGVTVLRMPVSEAVARARAGEFRDGQSALALLLAAPYL